MKIIKVPITEQNKEIFFSKGKNNAGKEKWEQLLSQSQHMTAKEFWQNEPHDDFEMNRSNNWYFIAGNPESIIDELVKLRLGESNVYYPWIHNHSPEDLIESRTDWGRLKELADEMHYFIESLCDYI